MGHFGSILDILNLFWTFQTKTKLSDPLPQGLSLGYVQVSPGSVVSGMHSVENLEAQQRRWAVGTSKGKI